jgi:hypothetical protein
MLQAKVLGMGSQFFMDMNVPFQGSNARLQWVVSVDDSVIVAVVVPAHLGVCTTTAMGSSASLANCQH